MLRLARPLAAPARRQLLSRSILAQSRGFAERKETMLSSDPSFAPSSPSPAAATNAQIPIPPASATTSKPISVPTIPPENVPKVPPPPPTTIQVPPPQTASPPPPPPPPPPKKSKRFQYILYLLLAGVITYGGGVAYALNNDNFHDFFTEYIPFGEEAVLYFEERSFQKRFPNAKQHVYRAATSRKEDDKKVTIPFKSGLSWKVADENVKGGSDLTTKGKHMSAVDTNEPKKQEVKDAAQAPGTATNKEKVKAVETAKKDSGSSSTPAPATSKTEPTTSKVVEPAPAPAKSESRPPVIAPVSSISALSVPNADEPVVQELVKIMNDLITVVNADGSGQANQYSAPMQKAKESLTAVAGKITALRDAERAAAEERIKEAHKEFDEGAKQLLQRIETAQREDDIKYREEFESERAKIAELYESKLKTELERTKDVMEQKLKNELTEQGIEMKRKFVADIKSLVESERDGRLSKLTDLSSNVDNLSELTSNWNGIIDANLATQKLQVAVDAVRSTLEASNYDQKPKPFVREMAALKLIANSDPIVDAAVASINPNAYQRGIPSSAQLIDRFRRVASEVRKASLLPEDAGVASHAASLLLSKVMFKKQGQPEGEDVESILTRTETLLEEGDLDNAAREMNGLQGWASVLSKDWLSDVRKVLEVQQALDVIETEARLQCLRVG